MRRNRVLILFAVVFAMSTAVIWLGTVLAAVTIVNNNGLTVNEGDTGIIGNSLLLSDDPDNPDPTGESITYTLETTPSNGILVLTNTATTLTPNAQFTQSDINNNFLVYTHNDTETVSDSFIFTVTANSTNANDTFLIIITPVNEAPVVNPDTFTVAENSPNVTTEVGTVTALDPENNTLTFSITAGDPDNVFAIDPDTGVITVVDNSFLDYEAFGAPPHFSLTVQVVENATTDAFTDTATVEINVTDVNEAPTVNPDTFTVAENSPNVTTEVDTVIASDPEDNSLTYSITAGDTDNVFDIDPDTGVITVADNSFLDYEAFGAPPHFSLTVQVVENATTDAFTDTATIEINVTDVNETPTVNDNSFSINENSSNTTLVGIVTASDPDADDVGLLTFGILSGNTGGAFTISNNGSNSGQITVADSNQLDYETTQSFMLGIIVTDTGGLNNTANVTININNLFDEAPTVNNATFTVAEGSNNGVAVGTVSATDPEFASGDELTFAITGGNTGTVFAINSSTGQITVPDTSKLDADTMPTFNLTVRATDKGGQIDTGIITINVTPLPTYYVYMPILMNNYPPIEPNNNCSQSYGIGSGRDYTFTADDTEDWYAITLTSSKNLTVILSSFEPAQGQLIVYSGSCGSLTLLGSNGNPNTTDKTLNLGVRPAGTYYIRVYSQPVTNTTYTLRVNTN